MKPKSYLSLPIIQSPLSPWRLWHSRLSLAHHAETATAHLHLEPALQPRTGPREPRPATSTRSPAHLLDTFLVESRDVGQLAHGSVSRLGSRPDERFVADQLIIFVLTVCSVLCRPVASFCSSRCHYRASDCQIRSRLANSRPDPSGVSSLMIQRESGTSRGLWTGGQECPQNRSDGLFGRDRTIWTNHTTPTMTRVAAACVSNKISIIVGAWQQKTRFLLSVRRSFEGPESSARESPDTQVPPPILHPAAPLGDSCRRPRSYSRPGRPRSRPGNVRPGTARLERNARCSKRG